MDAADDTLTLDIEGWEGPLDLLLALARSHKVDLKQISILQLVEQYLTYVEHARTLKLDVAARTSLPGKRSRRPFFPCS